MLSWKHCYISINFFFRATLATLSYVILAFGSLFAHLLSHLVPWVAGLCVLNLIIGRKVFEKLVKLLIKSVVMSNFLTAI